MTVKQLIENINELKKKKQITDNFEIIVFNPDMATVDEVEDICINGNAIQINIVSDREWR